MTTRQSQNWMEQVGATPGKLALIGVLALVLVFVLVRNFRGTSAPKVELATPAEVAASTRPNARERTPKLRVAITPAIEAWPQPVLEEVLSHDPLALPTWARTSPEVNSGPRSLTGGGPIAPTASPQQQALAQLKEQGATAIVEIDGTLVALVGDKTIRVGDRLEGYYVKRISQAGVVLSSERQSPQ
ncbi:hypothetical protein [Aeoliella mucimassa]|uniref:Uncharacterized protein n=1 Tax=Aeoliella mucimassa TaxID=2527972 RepID=A0A518AJ59_9BACT|nr:hypothetical protein [Aeoliella mucimassa]QDU54769.1 hypothetical protein Pan181_09520 [Aeoliella mucimassa]